MHRLIETRFEEYLEGALDGEQLGQFEAHLTACRQCREAVEQMREQASLLRVLRVPEEIEPSPGFYGRVVDRIDTERRPSVWAGLLQPSFARQLVYSSLIILLLLGGYILSGNSDSSPFTGHSATVAEKIMASRDRSDELGVDRNRDRDEILVTLATYDQ